LRIHATNPAGRRLHGKSVIITGAARGQGASHAERLAAEGAHVLACDVLDVEGKATADRLRQAGLEVDYLHLDVTSPDDWDQAIRHARGVTGRLDVLVNNAGIIHVTPLLEEQPKDWDATLAVNATGPLLGIQAAVPLMRQNRGRAGAAGRPVRAARPDDDRTAAGRPRVARLTGEHDVRAPLNAVQHGVGDVHGRVDRVADVRGQRDPRGDAGGVEVDPGLSGRDDGVEVPAPGNVDGQRGAAGSATCTPPASRNDGVETKLTDST
jgi:NAD(P)-dependent dehydrogenase (short-subunit alcohol dehydrogenase family)